MHFFSVLLVFFFLTSCNDRPDISSEDVFFTVTKVVDGDTFWIDDGSPKGLKIRLIGIDAPETQRSSRKEIGYFGEEAKAFLTELLKDEKVHLEYDVGRKDRYGRTLAYAYLKDGTFINATLLENGYATVLTVPPNVRHADFFLSLQQKARKGKKGLWNKY